ncbi:MAG: sulfotransferase [Phycisphaerales bacterium JB052]
MSELFPAHPADDLARAFVVGCKKSGTTWMQALLEVHPQVCSRGEAGFAPLLATPMFEQLNAYNQQQRAGAINTYSGEDALTLARFAIDTLQRKWIDLLPEPEQREVRVIADKSPEHALSLDVLHAIYPEMKTIHIIRDGRDCLVSGWHYNMRGNTKAFRSQFVSMESYASYFAKSQWVPSITRAQQWGAKHPDQYLELRYEALLASPDEQAQRIFDFLGVDTCQPVIEQIIERTSFKTLSGGRDQGETNNQSHFRKGTSGSWREELDERSVLVFEQIAGSMLDSLGYPRANAVSV